MTRTFSTSAKPLPFYADGEVAIEQLIDKFGSHLEQIEAYEKLALLATISVKLCSECVGEESSLSETYLALPNAVAMTGDLEEILPSLDTLSHDNLLGLCEALVAQIRYTREVA